MTSTFITTKSRLSLTSPPPLPTRHWSQTCHETILLSNDINHPIRLSLIGGADNGQFICFNESISLLKNKSPVNIVKGGKIDFNEIILDIDQHHISGCTLADVHLLIDTLSTNGKQIRLTTVKHGLTKDLRQFLDGRFEKGSIDYNLQQTIRDNLYMRTVPCTTRPPRSSEINGQDYTFLSVKDFRALEKNGNLLESGVYKGHYYGTPRPTKGTIKTNTNLIRRSNSADEMFQNYDPELLNKENSNANLTNELIRCSLKKSSNGFGFTIIGTHEKGEQYLQIKEIIPDGPAAKDGKLQRGDILIYINDANVLGYSHTEVVKIFQSLSIGDIIHLTVCRGYPLTVNFDDPQIDVVSLNGVHHLPNGGYREYPLEDSSRIYTIKIRKGDQGFGFTVADSLFGQRVKTIVDKQRCQNLCENDLLLAINGQNLSEKRHLEVVDILKKCSKDIETIFIIRRGDSDVNNNSFMTNGNNHLDKNIQENNQIETRYPPSQMTETPRSKTPTPFGSAPLADALPLRSRTPLPTTITSTNNNNFNYPIETSAPLAQIEFSPDSVYQFDRQTTLSRSARDIRPTHPPILRSKTPGPEFGATPPSAYYHANTMKPRSKTPTAYEFSANTLQNSRSLQSVHPQQYSELVVNLTLLRPNDGFGLRILGGEEEKSQVSIGHIVPNSPADIDGRLRIDDEIIKIDNHSTIRASHEKVVQLMQRAKEHQHVCLIVRRYTNPNNKNISYLKYHDDLHKKPSIDSGLRLVTLQKTSDNQSFGFVIISSQNRAGATIGKIIPHSPADQCGQLHVNDHILAVNGVDLTHMIHTDIVKLIKESGRTILLTIDSRVYHDERTIEISHTSNAIRPSSSTTGMSDSNNQTLRNAFSHNPLNASERNLNRSSSKTNGVLKSSSISDDYFIVSLQRSSINSSFGFSIRGGREFSVPLFILKLAENGPAAYDGRMSPGDQIIEINSRSTYGMTHNEAILLIREGGLHVRLLIRKTNAPPPSLEEVRTAMESPNIQWTPSAYT